MGRKRTCKPTEIETQYGINESGAMGILPMRTMPSGKALAASATNEAMYGPRKTVPTVALKAELAQSYIAQPKISLLSFTIACACVTFPPGYQIRIGKHTAQREVSKSIQTTIIYCLRLKIHHAMICM